jgi:anti-sigma factor RsiW
MSDDTNAPAVSEDDLHAYADGLLDETRRARVEAHLAVHADDAERVRAWRDWSGALGQVYNPVLDEPVPARLSAAQLRRPRRWVRFSVAAAVLIAGAALGWVARGSLYGLPLAGGGASALARQAAVAYAVYSPEVRHPVEVWAPEEAHLVAWLSKRLGTTLRCPKLDSLGYNLVGGRLLPGPNGPVAQFMFQDTQGARLTLYVSRQRGEQKTTAFRFSQEGKVAVFYWIDGDFGYALSAEASRADLLQAATLVYKQLNPE